MLYLLLFIVAVSAFLFITNVSAQRNKFKEVGATDVFTLGKCLTGLLDCKRSTGVVNCAVNEDDFVFIVGYGETVGSIPRDSINQVSIENRSQITQRVTIGRMLALGVFSLAVPKKEKNELYYILIDWDDEKGINNNTLFESTNMKLANDAINKIKQSIKPKRIILKADEAKCPYCAEIIKKEAKICKYCKSEIEA